MNRSLVSILFSIYTTVVLAQNWEIQRIDSFVFNDASIVTDAQSYPQIVYSVTYPRTKLRYAKWNGSFWEFQDIESISGTSVSFEVTKLRLDRQGIPHIAYFRQYPAYYFQIRYAFWNGTSWQITTIDSFYAGNYWHSAFTDQRNLDLTLNSNDTPYLSYPWINLTDSIWEVRVAYKRSDTWTINIIWQKRFRRGYANTFRTRIAINTAELPIVTFDVNYWDDNDTSSIYVAYSEADTWRIERVDGHWDCQILPFDLEIDATNRFHLLYSRDFGVFYSLKQNDSWTTEWTGVVLDLSSNHGALALDSSNNPNIVCSSPLAPPTYAYKEGAIWHYEIIEQWAGLYPDIAIDEHGNKHGSYLRVGNTWHLCYARRIAPGVEEGWTPDVLRLTLKITPNPAKSVVRVRYSIPSPSSKSSPIKGEGFCKVTLQLYDITGRLVKTLFDEYQKPGNYSLTLNSKTLPSDVYFLYLATKEKRIIERLVVIK